MVEYSVYKHTFPNGKVYVGITSQNVLRRWAFGNGYKHNAHLTKAFKKYGWGNIQHEILFQDLSKETAEQMEIKIIKDLKANIAQYGYNICSGGYVNIPTESSRLKISMAAMGNKRWVGKRHSEETKNRMRGRTFSKETRFKMSISRKLRITSNETKRLMSKNRIGRLKSDSHKKALSVSNKIAHRLEEKPVVQIGVDCIYFYSSIRDASKITGIDRANISRCCNGKQRKSSGFSWEFKEDYYEKRIGEIKQNPNGVESPKRSI